MQHLQQSADLDEISVHLISSFINHLHQNMSRLQFKKNSSVLQTIQLRELRDSG